MTRSCNGMLDLQLFGAGDVVHGTQAFVNANAPANSKEYVATPGSESGLSAEMKTFYDKTLIELSGPSLVFDQFGQKRPIPQNGGKTIEFRKFSSLPKALTPITEGVTPTGSKLTVVPVTTTVDQYGDYVELTDMIELTSVDPIVVEATKQLADQAGRTIDTVVRNQIIGGTNVYYCPKVSADGKETEVTSRSDLGADAKLRVKDVFKAAAILKAMNAPSIDGSYVAVIHPYVAYDLMQDAEGQWLDIQKYTDPATVLRGEIGTLGGVRFVQTTEAKVYHDGDLGSSKELTVTAYTGSASSGSCTSGIATESRVTVSESVTDALVGRDIYYTNTSGKVFATIVGVNTTSKYIYLDAPLSGVTYASGDKLISANCGKDGAAVFATMFLGANAYGTTDIGGGGIEHIVKQKGYGNDPLNQRSSVGWKATKAAARLVEEYMLRVESGSSFNGSSIETN
ncbi:MAG: N4-gp56 family major capsid protein [Clostridiales bacterium]|jgi:N4-gp56 family major capsid protein|nr:N4-gp56 family major capsid protein [Clostridiales bacterium]